MKITHIDFDASPRTGITPGQPVALAAQLFTDDPDTPILPDADLEAYDFEWKSEPSSKITPQTGKPWLAVWTPTLAKDHTIRVYAFPKAGGRQARRVETKYDFSVQAPRDALTVTLAPAGSSKTGDDGLYQSIRESTRALDFSQYKKFVDRVMCPYAGDLTTSEISAFNKVNARRSTVFPGVDAYQRLKVATEVYLMMSVNVLAQSTFSNYDADIHKNRHGFNLTLAELKEQWLAYLQSDDATSTNILPVDNFIRRKLNESIIPSKNGDVTACDGLLQAKLSRPCFCELIWSYWHEEGMLVQTMKAIALRFQNQRVSDRDPLANFDISPLHPLSNLLWGYIQDEQHRLTVPRRAYEYDHHYGIVLDGKVVPTLRSADSRSKFIEAFHNLLHGALLFYKQDDDTTKRADGFPVLNGLKEVHLLLREGMHNQFGDLPSTARLEMLMEQWILARPEMQDFLGGRAMMPYSEEWMDRVDTMKKLKGWTDVSVTYFNELAEFGEMLLLSIRHGNWSNIHDAAFAAHWARECRPEIQQYVHAYRTATGVDLSPERSDVRLAADRYVQPSAHLRKRLDAQRPAEAGALGSPRRAGGLNGKRNGSNPPGALQTSQPRVAQTEVESLDEF